MIIFASLPKKKFDSSKIVCKKNVLLRFYIFKNAAIPP